MLHRPADSRESLRLAGAGPRARPSVVEFSAEIQLGATLGVMSKVSSKGLPPFRAIGGELGAGPPQMVLLLFFV